MPRAATVVAGRVCPSDYSYDPAIFNRSPDFAADVLYVVGGLYGNIEALDALDALLAAERAPASVVFNGDFHWFDADPKWFAEVERRVTPHRSLRGNVEFEIARAQDIGAGCGCAYPAAVDDATVRRSNEILAALRATAAANPFLRNRLRTLPMTLVARVGGLKVGIVHGDAGALAGWRFAHNALDDRAHTPWLEIVRQASRVDVFASTHTCLAALRDFALRSGRLSVVNNGAAGMPNFTGAPFGVVTRIATRPSPHRPLYGMARDGIHFDALALPYDNRKFIHRFLMRWPEKSAAHQSYYGRIAAGPTYTLEQARLPMPASVA